MHEKENSYELGYVNVTLLQAKGIAKAEFSFPYAAEGCETLTAQVLCA